MRCEARRNRKEGALLSQRPRASGKRVPLVLSSSVADDHLHNMRRSNPTAAKHLGSPLSTTLAVDPSPAHSSHVGLPADGVDGLCGVALQSSWRSHAQKCARDFGVRTELNRRSTSTVRGTLPRRAAANADRHVIPRAGEEFDTRNGDLCVSRECVMHGTVEQCCTVKRTACTLLASRATRHCQLSPRSTKAAKARVTSGIPHLHQFRRPPP